MSLAVVYGRALNGMQAPLVEVEAHLANGLPVFNIVGLPDTEVKESRDRVRAAILQSGFDFPAKRITVNLAPADLPKESSRLDLPIAIGILAASGQVLSDGLADYEFAGELALSGQIRPVRGVLAMVWQAFKAQRGFILPRENTAMATLVAEAQVYPAHSLAAVAAHLNGLTQIEPAQGRATTVVTGLGMPDLKDIKGQHTARLALEIAAAGGHSLLLVGPPGTGKSMLASRLPSILPPLSNEEMIESAALRSLYHNIDEASLHVRPFRSPHHSASAVALVGGGSDPRPGEISLAHHGVLFLDELPEFGRNVLEVLREPLETGEIHISRAARQATFPARFQLVAAMNPCPCGYLGHISKPCRCSQETVARYQGKISGPLLDRIDLSINVPSLDQADLADQAPGEGSDQVKERVAAARARQMARQGVINARLSVTELDEVALISPEAKQCLGQLMTKLALSARSYHRLLRVARTVADLDDHTMVAEQHLLKAVSFRRI